MTIDTPHFVAVFLGDFVMVGACFGVFWICKGVWCVVVFFNGLLLFIFINLVVCHIFYYSGVLMREHCINTT